MKIVVDKEADASYIYFKEIVSGEVKNTISLNDSVHIDLDSGNKIIGIEILNISKNLPESSIKEESIFSNIKI